MGSSRTEFVSTTSASTVAMADIAAVPAAASAADHSAAASPTLGDSVATTFTPHHVEFALTRSASMANGKVTTAVEFLLFNDSPETTRVPFLNRLSGAM